MQPTFNEFCPTITNVKSGMMDFPNFSPQQLEDDKSRAQPNYKCSLIEIPEFGDSQGRFNFFRPSDDPQLIDFFKRQKASLLNFSNNSILNFDNFHRNANPAFRPTFADNQDSVLDLDSALILKNLWISRKNLFENDPCPEWSSFQAELGPRPSMTSPATKPTPSHNHSHTPLQPILPRQTNQRLAINPANQPLNPLATAFPTGQFIKKEKVACHCKKSKCLRLYCECFAKGLICGVDCSCDGCHNTNDLSGLREAVVQETLEKNPFAFKSKYKKMKDETKLLHSRGCNCSKTGCIKKYCECYNAGTGCSRLCKCSNCKNENIELEDAEVKIYYDRVLRKRSKKSVLSECFENGKPILPSTKQV